MALPASIEALVEIPPVEDLILPVLRARMPDMAFHALIEDAAEMPFALVRGGVWGVWDGDERGLLQVTSFNVHTYTTGVDGDQDGARLQEAVRVSLRNAGRAQDSVPDVGHLVRVTLQTEPRRVPDWATSQGPVQFADLPTETWRYEALYRVVFRPAR